MSSSLFADFAPADKAVWEKQAQRELKEKFDLLSKYNVAGAISVEAYSTAQDLNLEQISAMQQCQKSVPGWLNLPSIRFEDTTNTNTEIKNALSSGGDGAWIELGGNMLSAHDFLRLFKDIRLSDHTFFFKSTQPAHELFQRLSGNTGYQLKGGIAFDPIANRMRTGASFEPFLSSVVGLSGDTLRLPGFRSVMVESHIYHNNGADPVQELAFTLSCAVTYMDLLTNAGFSAAQAFNELFFSVSIGTSYLTEIAKLRALRHLKNKITLAYQISDEQAGTYIHTQTSHFYHSDSASHTNLIRTSSEAMSAVIGGCDALTVSGFQGHLSRPAPLSDRIARNTSSVLSFEGYLDLVADPAAGSYSIEMLSQQLSAAAWELFIEVEEKGGLISCFENGFVQKELRESLDKKISDLNGTKVMVGLNRFTEPETVYNPGNMPQTGTSPFLTDLRLSECFKNQQQAL
jgi:methylmalonyl-CoA mutase